MQYVQRCVRYEGSCCLLDVPVKKVAHIRETWKHRLKGFLRLKKAAISALLVHLNLNLKKRVPTKYIRMATLYDDSYYKTEILVKQEERPIRYTIYSALPREVVTQFSKEGCVDLWRTWEK